MVETQHLCVQNTPLVASYNSYSLMAAAAAAAHSSGQGLGCQPVGSLEALRATWHAPQLHGQGAWTPGSLGGQRGSFGGQSGQQQSPQSLHGQGLNGSLRQQGYLSSLQAVQEHNRCPSSFSGSLSKLSHALLQSHWHPSLLEMPLSIVSAAAPLWESATVALVMSGVGKLTQRLAEGHVNRDFRQLLGLRPKLGLHQHQQYPTRVQVYSFMSIICMGTKRGYLLYCCMPCRAMSNETSGSYWASGPNLSDLDASSLPHKPEVRTNRVRRSLDRSTTLERSTGDDASAVQMQQSAAAAPMHGAHVAPAQSSAVSNIPLSFAAAGAMFLQAASHTIWAVLQSGLTARICSSLPLSWGCGCCLHTTALPISMQLTRRKTVCDGAQASNGAASSHRGWPSSTGQGSSASAQASQDGSLAHGERQQNYQQQQQQQNWQAFAQSVSAAPDQDGAHLAAQRDAWWRSSLPDQATQVQPQQPLQAVPEGGAQPWHLPPIHCTA